MQQANISKTIILMLTFHSGQRNFIGCQKLTHILSLDQLQSGSGTLIQSNKLSTVSHISIGRRFAEPILYVGKELLWNSSSWRNSLITEIGFMEGRGGIYEILPNQIDHANPIISSDRQKPPSYSASGIGH
jgi:hypothetical protein